MNSKFVQIVLGQENTGASLALFDYIQFVLSIIDSQESESHDSIYNVIKEYI